MKHFLLGALIIILMLHVGVLGFVAYVFLEILAGKYAWVCGITALVLCYLVGLFIDWYFEL